jgi:anionic cell wall polymer biosynthesis LytR-Cps2A-Psr (LCP) family protein
MERQRCVIGAIIDEARPMTLLRHYRRLAGALEDVFFTDIPQTLLPAFAELADRVQQSTVASLAFTDDVITPAAPDYELMHSLAAEAIETPPATTTEGETGEATTTEGTPTGGAPATSTSPPADTEPGDEDPSTPEPGAEPQSLDAVC